MPHLKLSCMQKCTNGIICMLKNYTVQNQKHISPSSKCKGEYSGNQKLATWALICQENSLYITAFEESVMKLKHCLLQRQRIAVEESKTWVYVLWFLTSHLTSVSLFLYL